MSTDVVAAAQLHYFVYVVELDAADRGANAVYVGQSWHPPETRLAQHRAGIKASRYVRQSGVRLRPELARGWGPYACRADAERAEAALAESLRGRGFVVYGGH